MSDGWANWIAAVTGVGTLLIAIAAVVIAKRQTEVSVELQQLTRQQAEAAEVQAESARRQTDISEQLAALEQSRDVPHLVPGPLKFVSEPEPALIVEIVNAGGGCAIDVWIEAIALLEYGATPENVHEKVFPVETYWRIDVLRDSATKSLGINTPASEAPDVNFEKVVVVIGNAHLVSGAVIPVLYETVPGLAHQHFPEAYAKFIPSTA